MCMSKALEGGTTAVQLVALRQYNWQATVSGVCSTVGGLQRALHAVVLFLSQCIHECGAETAALPNEQLCMLTTHSCDPTSQMMQLPHMHRCGVPHIAICGSCMLFVVLLCLMAQSHCICTPPASCLALSTVFILCHAAHSLLQPGS